jgi:hypothetical protein
MKTFIYFKIQNSLQEDILGWFKIGNDVAPLIFKLEGEIVFEYEFEKTLNILESDAAFLKSTNQKKIPTNVVCYCKEYPCGGWSTNLS